MNSEASTPTRLVLNLAESAQRDFRDLDHIVRGKVASQLLKIQVNPFAGEGLSHDLAGLRKIYVDKKRYRIVWQVRAGEGLILVLGIGRRDKDEIYNLIRHRQK